MATSACSIPSVLIVKPKDSSLFILVFKESAPSPGVWVTMATPHLHPYRPDDHPLWRPLPMRKCCLLRYFDWLSVGILNKVPFELDAVWVLLLLLELFPLSCPLPRDPNIGMLCFVDELCCCCSCAKSPAFVVCCFVPLPVSNTIFEGPEVAESPVDWSRGLVSWERKEDEAVEVVCFSGRRNVVERVTWGLLSDACKKIKWLCQVIQVGSLSIVYMLYMYTLHVHVNVLYSSS